MLVILEDKKRFKIQANNYIKKYRKDNNKKENITEIYRDILYSKDKCIIYRRTNINKRFFKIKDIIGY